MARLLTLLFILFYFILFTAHAIRLKFTLNLSHNRSVLKEYRLSEPKRD